MARSHSLLPWLLALFLVSGSLTLASSGLASDEGGAGGEAAGINAELERFSEDPAKAMNAPLTRFDEAGKPVKPGNDLRFPVEAIASGEAVAARDQRRARMCTEVDGETKCLGPSSGVGTFAEIQGNDRPEALVDGGVTLRTLEAIEAQGLRQTRLSVQPWSDDYWGFYKGVLGARYADPAFPAAQGGDLRYDWKANHDYVLNRPAEEIVDSGDPAAIDLLSPSEKYELLVGDDEARLTDNLWDIGESYYDASGRVATWMGICHGWGPAALMLPRPERTLTLMAADGRTPIRFYPADAKALASLLWANGSAPIRFVGGRCNTADPQTDANGRVISSQCFDTNPGAWHLAVVNQLGVARRSFVLDATYDYEVWNQPALGYRYAYFNPQTMTYVASLNEAKVSMGRFSTDRFRPYRSPRAAAVAGIVMDFTYVSETRPSHRQTDAPGNDALRTVRYIYDLELDASGNIVGGEWYTNLHPDFLWVPAPGARAVSIAEGEATGSWNIAQALPLSWRKAAIRAETESQPLAKIVEALLQASRATD